MQIYHILTQDMPVPNVIVYLTASLETLQNESPCAEENLKTWIQITYYSSQKIMKQQWMLLKDHPEIPVLKFNGDDMDFVKILMI